MQPLKLINLPAEVLVGIINRCEIKGILSLYRTNRYLRSVCERKVNDIFSAKLKSNYPEQYELLLKLDALKEHSFCHYINIDVIKKSPQICKRQEDIAFCAMIANKIIAICVSGYFLGKWIIAAAAKSKAAWIQNWLSNHPGASIDQAQEAYRQWIASISIYRGR